MPRDLDLTFDISTGALTLDRVVGNYVKRSETLTLSVTIVSNGASATIPAGLVGTLKPVNTYGTTLAQWTTFAQVGATNVYTASTTINAAAVTTLLGTTTEQANCVFDFAGAGVVESDTLALVLKNNVTRDDDTAPTALLNRNDFLVSNGTGLLVNVAAGYAANGAFVAAQASLAITNATNYIEVTAAGVASVNTTAFTAGRYPLATVIANAGAITANTDLRAWITPKPSADELPSQTGNSGKYLTTNGTATSWGAVSTGLTVGTTAIASGTSGRILYDNAGVLGELPVGTGVATALAVNVGSAGAFLTSAVTSITGTANEITVTGTTTPTLSLPSALTLTGKTVTGGTFNSPTLFEPSSKVYKILDNQDGTMKGRFTNDFTHVYLDSGGDVFLRTTDFVSSYLTLAHFSASTGRMSLGYPAFLSGKIGFKNATSTGTTTLDSANASANDYTATLQAATGTLALVSGNLGTPSAIVLTNATGTAASLTAGNVTTIPALSGAITNTGNATVLGSFTMAQLSTAVSDGDPAYVGAANTFTTGQTISSTTSLLLGTAGSAVGNVGFRNATSGTTTLAPAAGALGTGTVTLPLTGTLATLEGSNTYTGTTNTFTLPTTTGTTTTSGISVAGNSLTTGTGIYAASSSLTSGKLLDLQVSGTAAAASQTVLNIATAGANGTSGITSKGAVIANTHTGTTSTNVALELTASGGTTNTALNVTAGAIVLQQSPTKYTTITPGAVGGLVFALTTDGSNLDANYGITVPGKLTVSGTNGYAVSISASGAIQTSAALQGGSIGWLNNGAVGFSFSGTTVSTGASTTVLSVGATTESTTTTTGAIVTAGGIGVVKNANIGGTLAVTGASTLTGLLAANGGITLGDAQNIAFNTTTGTKIGATTSQKLSFWAATPIVQPTTAVASATVASPGGGSVIKTDDTFDGYTIAQVVKALRNAGLLA